MIIRHRYIADTDCEADGCPFCGSEVSFTAAETEMSLPQFYCDRCKIEFTIDERHVDEANAEIRNFTPRECLDKWDQRAEGATSDDCPFCGGRIQEWPLGHYLFDSLFDSLWCPTCKKRFQFQSHPHSKKSMVRTMKEFGRRVS